MNTICSTETNLASSPRKQQLLTKEGRIARVMYKYVKYILLNRGILKMACCFHLEKMM